MAEPNIATTLVTLVEQAVSKYWWVAVVVALIWYLRWYRVALQAGKRASPKDGVYAAIITLKHMALAGRKSARAAVFGGLAVLAALGWMFDIIPVLTSGLGNADPLVWALSVASVVAGFAAVDAPFSTPMMVGWYFLITLVGLLALNTIRSYTAEKETGGFSARRWRDDIDDD